jgi:hypothetical protein
VTIPFAEQLAAAMPPVAVRLRRDFGSLLALIRAHAVLHEATRERDRKGRIIATLDDYTVVRELVADLVAEGVEASVRHTVRDTVEAVAEIADENGVHHTAIARYLKLDKSAARRRMSQALEAGYLRNLEERGGRPARLVLGDALPEEVEILPLPERLVSGGTVASESEVVTTTPTANGRFQKATEEQLDLAERVIARHRS